MRLAALAPILLAACADPGSAPWEPAIVAGPDDDDPIEEPDFGPLPAAVTDHLDLSLHPADVDDALPDLFLTGRSADLEVVPDDNRTTRWGSQLGRVLFYDRALSVDGTVACASCHLQAAAFGDPARFSPGVDGVTARHGMSLVNSRYYPRGRFFWDERAPTLEDQVTQPIVDPVEMGHTPEGFVDAVAAQPWSDELFTRAFGDPTVDEDRIGRALAQFVRTLVSFQSPWDEGVAATDGDVWADFPNFSASENRGKTLFLGGDDARERGRCGSCHLHNGPFLSPDTDLGNVVIFQPDSPRNNGLDDRITDPGAAAPLDQPRLTGAFKAPSLRNAEVTGPYMHDGRFETLEDVVAFYSDGVQLNPFLDVALRDGFGARSYGFDAQQQADLVAFLRTLTDDAFLHEPAFADPFLAP